MPPKPTTPPYPAAKVPVAPAKPGTPPAKAAPFVKGKPTPKAPVVPLKASMARRLAK